MTSRWQLCKRWESKTCDLSAPAISILLCSYSCLKTLLAQRALLTLQVRALLKLKFWIFPLITYFKYHVTEYCAVIGTHSTVWGDKLLYGHVPDPFPRCGIGSDDARLICTLGFLGCLPKTIPEFCPCAFSNLSFRAQTSSTKFVSIDHINFMHTWNGSGTSNLKTSVLQNLHVMHMVHTTGLAMQ